MNVIRFLRRRRRAGSMSLYAHHLAAWWINALIGRDRRPGEQQQLEHGIEFAPGVAAHRRIADPVVPAGQRNGRRDRQQQQSHHQFVFVRQLVRSPGRQSVLNSFVKENASYHILTSNSFPYKTLFEEFVVEKKGDIFSLSCLEHFCL